MPSTRLFFAATGRRPASGALVLLLSVFTTNSGGQSRTPMPEASTGKSQPTPAIRERLTKTQGTTPFDNVHCGMRDKAGNLWFGTTDGGVYRYDGKVVTRFLSDAAAVNAKMLTLKDVQQMLEDNTGAIWFASWNNEGACRYDGRTLTDITAREGLNDGMVHSLLQDKAGDIWFGTRNHGLCRYDGKSFKHITGVEGLSDSCVCSILKDKAGVLWFATEKNGVWRYDGKSFTNLTTKDGLGNNSVFCIVEDGEGHLWFGTRDVGLSRYDGRTFTEFSASGSQR
jgi:streptogramin lyase